jgi:hypothetical protein
MRISFYPNHLHDWHYYDYYTDQQFYLPFVAKDFSTAQKKVAELIHGRILVGHALSNDLKVHFSGYSFFP